MAAKKSKKTKKTGETETESLQVEKKEETKEKAVKKTSKTVKKKITGTVLKCKMCGGSLTVNDDTGIAVCEYCGTRQTVTKTNDDVLSNLYNRANNLRLKNEFDKAQAIYEKIVEQDDAEAEAHWGIVLCKYGIEYVDDPNTGKKIPTCHRSSYDSIRKDIDYQAAIDFADPSQQALYEEEAREIDRLQKDILSIARNEEPFDVFICYKETDENGSRTIDSVLANDLYYELKREGFKVFFSRITLEDKLGQEYEPYIFAALNSAKVMVALGTRPEYYNAVWVKNEWSRYLKLIAKGERKILIPAYRDMDPYDLPEEFSHLQALDMSKLGFMQDLIRGIKKIIGKDEQKVSEKTESTVSSGVEPLLRRAFIFLEDRDFESADNYFDRVLDQDPENGRAYLGKAMIGIQAETVDEFFDHFKQLYHSDNDTVRASCDLGELYDKDYIEAIADKYAINNFLNKQEILDIYASFNDKYDSLVAARTKEKEAIYDTFNNDRNLTRMRSFAQGDLRKRLDDLFDTYDHRIEEAKEEEKELVALIKQNYVDFLNDSENKVKALNEEAQQKRNDFYNQNIELLNRASSSDMVRELIRSFEQLEGYEDSNGYIERCNEKIFELDNKKKKNTKTAIIIAAAVVACVIFYLAYIVPLNKYNKATALSQEGKYEEAIELFENIRSFKDAPVQLDDSRFSLAKEQLGNTEYDKARDTLSKINEHEGLQEAVNEADYLYAGTLTEDGKYDEAIAIYGQLKGYKDADTMLLQSKYDKALALAEEQKYDESISLLESLGEFEDAPQQVKNVQKQKQDNEVAIPKIIGTKRSSAESKLNNLGLACTVKEVESQYDKVGTVLSVSPDVGTVVLKGTLVEMTVTKGLSRYENYSGNSNNNVLYQVNITAAGNSDIIRIYPTTKASKTGVKAKAGEAYNVYEEVSNEGYTWLRTDNNHWFPTESSWVEKDSYCNASGDYTVRKAWINDDDDGAGVYDRPIEDANIRQQVDKVANGSEVTVYFSFYNGSHNWYKIGANRWIKDVYGEKIYYHY